MPSLELESPQSVSFTVRNRASFTPSRKRRPSTTAILRLSANSAERHSGQYTTTSAGSSSSSGTPANRARSPETRPHSLHWGRRVSLAEQAATSHPVRGRGDTDALIKLRVACDIAITAAPSWATRSRHGAKNRSTSCATRSRPSSNRRDTASPKAYVAGHLPPRRGGHAGPARPGFLTVAREVRESR